MKLITQATIGLLAFCVMACSAQPVKKNVLFIVSDDLNCYLGAYGNKHVKTPNMDRLAERGTVFTNAQCQFPVCGPSRASFMSGLRPNTTRVLSNGPSLYKNMPDVVTIPRYFRENGYTTARIGKIFNSVDNSDKRDWEYLLNARVPSKKSIGGKGKIIEAGHKHWNFQWQAAECEDEDISDGANTAAVVKWLGEKREKPFFMAVGLKKPHQPLVVPKKYYDLYDKKSLPKAWVLYEDENAPPESMSTASIKRNIVMTDKDRVDCTLAYYAAVSFVDAQVGKLLDALKANSLDRNTVVVLFGDNGYHVGEHMGWGKNTLYESSSRVPLIIFDPDGKKKHICNDAVELIDLFPTLIDTCGLDVLAGLEGRSLAGIVKGKTVSTPTVGYTQVGSHNGWTIRTDRWRLINYNPANGKFLLFDMTDDPMELKNQATNPKRTELIKGLSKKAHTKGFK